MAVVAAVMTTLIGQAFASAPAASAEEAPSPVNRTVTIHPDQAVQSDFLGVGVDVIPVALMPNNRSKGYEEAYWEMDRKRIRTLKPKVARVWFQPDWMEPTKGHYDWESNKMKAFYKYLDVLREAGTEVELNYGWKVGRDIQSWFGIPGVAAADISAPQDVDAFAASASALLEQLIHQRDYANVKYLTFYNEPNGSWDFEAPGDQRAYYASIVRKVHERLTADDLRDDVQIWGPEEWNAAGWTQYMKDTVDDALDAYSFHIYGGNYDDLSDEISLRKDYVSPKPVVMTEFGFAGNYDSGWDAGYANYMIKAAAEGVKAGLVWQLNGVWIEDPNEGVDTNGTYTLWDSLAVTAKPNPRYYEVGLLSRYIPGHSSVLRVETGSPDLRAAAFKSPEGEYTIVLETKSGTDDRNVTFDFGGSNIGKTFYKHVYNEAVVPEENALIPGASATFAAGTSFADDSVGSGYNVIVYTTMPSQAQIAVSPAQAAVVSGDTLQLSAELIDVTGGVTWSVYGDGNGTISGSGLFTAPVVQETSVIAVQAASTEDPDNYGISLVRVLPATTAERVDMPAFDPPGGTYRGSQSIAITSAIGDAVIHYTTDGSAPTVESPAYSGPVQLNASTVLKAIAVKDGLADSPLQSALYRILPPSAGPAGYEICAQESQACAFPGIANVAFGAAGNFIAGTFDKKVTCSIAAFGSDPAPGNASKACYYKLESGERAATPAFSPYAGSYSSPQSVSITTATSGAEIRYTTDGSMPTAASALYTGPLTISSQTTLKAIAAKVGLTPSAIGLAIFKVVDSTGGPEGYTYCANEFGSCTFTGIASVAYGASGNFLYGSFENSAVCSLNNFEGSDPAYNIPKKCYFKKMTGAIVAKPEFSLADGIYSAVQSVTISSTTAGAEIRYTTDGSNPTASSTLYAGPISVGATSTIKAIAFKEDMNDSVVATANYTIVLGAGDYVYCADEFGVCTFSGNAIMAYGANGSFLYEVYSGPTTCYAASFGGIDPAFNTPKKCYYLPLNGPIVAKPAFDPPSGSYASSQSVAITTATPDADIYYTLDGSAPTSQSSLYAAPIAIGTTATLRAIAVKGGEHDSLEAKATYTISGSIVSLPVFDPPGGSYDSEQSVTIHSDTDNAEIRYTTDGSEPNASSALYGGPIAVSSAKTIKAIAMKSGMSDSNVATAAYAIADAVDLLDGFTRCSGEWSMCQFSGTATVLYGANDSFKTGTFTDGVLCYADSFDGQDPAPNVAKSCYYKPLTGETAAKPLFDLGDGIYGSSKSVTITTSTDGAAIYYTTDGSVPTTSSALYGGPIEVASTMTVKAFAVKPGMNVSAVAAANYAIVAGSGDYAYCADEFGTCSFSGTGLVAYGANGSFYYDVFTDAAVCVKESFGGLDPAFNTAKKCYVQAVSGPIAVKPVLSPAGGTFDAAQTVTISSATENAEIRYTTDGSAPTAASTPYTSPINVSSNTSVRAIAAKDGFHVSAEARADYRIVSDNAYLSRLLVNGVSVDPFDNDTLAYTVVLPAGTTAIPTVGAEAEDANATVVATQAESLASTATVRVTAQDGTTTRTYSVSFQVAASPNNGNPGTIVTVTTPAATPGKLAIDEAAWARALADGSSNGNGGVLAFDIPASKQSIGYAIELPASAFGQDDSFKRIEIASPIGTIGVPASMFDRTALPGKTIEIRIAEADRGKLSDRAKAEIGDRPIIDLSVWSGGNAIAWNDPASPITVSIPYKPAQGEDPEHIVVRYIDGQGNIVAVPSGRYDETTGTVTFTTTHFSVYSVAYVRSSFEDLASVPWAGHAVGVLTAKGIVNGVSESSFDPDGVMTRADFLVLLVRALSLSGQQGERFADVRSGVYYEEAVRVARGLGIAAGTGNGRFVPLAPITRADMIVLAERALKAAGFELAAAPASPLGQFADASDIPAYAEASFVSFVSEGIVLGDGNRIAPNAASTRAQAAVLLYRIYNAVN
ncbi:chitobiase/beta-hexosaminidase C-terminal domain-containing protein [Cohnella sp. GCM10027633]|uniref:chitobiase/beta-hexosaminidase C-terminal domain-containing protein n=1 Tax=unclassified Cohnella TaxID=2636738 RepID=UPI00364114D1